MFHYTSNRPLYKLVYSTKEIKMSQLSAELQEKAKIEVREDETRKQQSLEQFREWIAKHPFIKNCRTGKISYEEN